MSVSDFDFLNRRSKISSHIDCYIAFETLKVLFLVGVNLTLVCSEVASVLQI